MKNRLFIIIFCLTSLVWSCKNDKSGANTTQSDTAEKGISDYIPVDKTSRIIAYQDTLTNAQGTVFQLTFRGAELDGAVHAKVIKNEKVIFNKEVRAIGTMTATYFHDINADGEDDLVFYTNTADKTRIGNLYALIPDGSNSKFIFVLPYLTKPYVTNYFGRDSFYVGDGNIYRAFPKYDLNKYNQKKESGKKWLLTYTYKGQDTLQIAAGVVQ